MSKHPLFGLILVFVIYSLISKLQKKLNSKLLNPLLFTSILIIVILQLTGITYDDFNDSASILTSLIGPATVALAIPLYEKRAYLLKYPKTIIFSTLIGTLTHLLTVIIIGTLYKLPSTIYASLLPKSVTTAIAVDIARNLGGIANLTVAIVVITGIVGASLSDVYDKVFKINTPVAQGLAMGSAAHAVGTSKASEISDLHASMSALSLIITGIWTVILLPIVFPWL